MDEATWQTSFESWAQDLLVQRSVVGAALGLGDGGGAVFLRGLRARDRDSGLPVTPHTRFGLASVTKSFTAAAVMRLQEAGALAVEDPVARHLPDLRLPGLEGARPIRIEHLLSHTSGLPPLPTRRMVFALAGAPEDERPTDRQGAPDIRSDSAAGVMAALGAMDIAPLGAPGEVFSYSNDGYVLLGEIIARATGMAYEAYVTSQILEPAGMRETSFDAGAALRSGNFTRLYTAARDGSDGWRAADAGNWVNPRAWLAPGGLGSSAHDMLRYLEIYRTGGTVDGTRILSRESVAAMLEPRAECSFRTWYGFGLSMHDGPDGSRRYHHGGGRVGVSSHILVVPDRGLTAVCLTNTHPGPASDLANGLVNARVGLDPGTPQLAYPREAATVAPAADYAGSYASAEGARVRIAAQDGGVVLEVDGEQRVLQPVGADAFVTEANGDTTFLRFRRGPDGRVDAVTLGLRVVRRTAGEAAGG